MQTPQSPESPEARLRTELQEWEAFGRALPHELGAPLLKIEAFAEFLLQLQSPSLPDRARAHLKTIRREAGHARRLGDALLVIAPRSEQPLLWERVDLSSLAWQLVDMLREADASRKVEVAVQPGMSVMGDPRLLRLLLSNLLGNAWKFSSSRPAAHVAIRRTQSPSGECYCVSDDGVGFDMHLAARLFQPFARLHGVTEYAGVGVGLWIARRIVELHGGRIRAEAREGEGARICFSLRAAPPRARA